MFVGGVSDVLNTKEKIGMLKIENYKNKSKYENKQKKTRTKINNAKGGKTKKKKVNTC